MHGAGRAAPVRHWLMWPQPSRVDDERARDLGTSNTAHEADRNCVGEPRRVGSIHLQRTSLALSPRPRSWQATKSTHRLGFNAGSPRLSIDRQNRGHNVFRDLARRGQCPPGCIQEWQTWGKRSEGVLRALLSLFRVGRRGPAAVDGMGRTQCPAGWTGGFAFTYRARKSHGL
jgi:hypothetical protein